MFTRIPVAFTLFTVLASSIPVDAQETLRWNFKNGEEIKYNVVQNMQTVMVVGDNEIDQAMNQTMAMTWQVLGVGAGGEATMNQIVGRIQMKMAGGPAGALELDTSDPKKSENPFVNSMGEVFGKIVNQPFKVTMKPTGEVGEVVIPPKLIEAINSSAAGNANALNKETLEQMMKQSAVTLPANAVSPGSEWTSKQSVQLPFGTMVIKSNMTYVSKDATGHAVIKIVPEISVTPKEGAPVKMSLTSSAGEGKVLFDIARGRVVKSQLDLKMAMKIDSGQQVFTQQINQKTELTLVP